MANDKFMAAIAARKKKSEPGESAAEEKGESTAKETSESKKIVGKRAGAKPFMLNVLKK